MSKSNIRIAEKEGIDTAALTAAYERNRESTAGINERLYDEALRLGFKQVTESVRFNVAPKESANFETYPDSWFGGD